MRWLLLLGLLGLGLGQLVHISPPPLTPGEVQALVGPEPWLADRLDFCACFVNPIEELGGASCIEFAQDYAALWDIYLEDAAFETCLGACPCGLNVTQCFDVLGCAPSECDGLTRAVYTGPMGTEGVGACVAGAEACLNGTTVVLGVEVVPAAEVCSDQVSDFDCDGFPGCEDIDCFLDAACLNDTVEECFDVLACNASFCDGLFRQCYTGPNGTLGVGACAAGTETCVNGTASGCAGEVVPAAEVCSSPGLDADCDGLPGCDDPDCFLDAACLNDTIAECFDVLGCNASYCDGLTRPFYTGPGATEGVGACAAGLQACANGTTVVSTPEVTPVAEVCGDQVSDFDCDGQPGCADPDCVLDPVCLNGTVAECFDVLGCNASFCDGLTRPCYSGPNGTLDVGLCAAGAETCVNGTNSGCVGETLPVTELCDAFDRDCDGNPTNGFNLTSDPLNCGACGVDVDDGNVCTLDSCVGGTVVNDGPANDGLNCTLGGSGDGVCAAGNCTIPPGTVLSFSRTTTDESEVEPLVTFTIEATFINDPSLNMSIWDLGIMPYTVGQTPVRAIGQYFEPVVVNVTGDCTANPEWADFDYADNLYYPVTKVDREVLDPIAFVTPGTGLASCTIVAAVSTEYTFVKENFGLCLPFLDNTTQTSGSAEFRTDGVATASSSSSWTRCPYGGHYTFEVTGRSGGPINVNIVSTFIQRRLANDVILVMDVTGALPLSGCAATSASSPSCYVDATGSHVANNGLNFGTTEGDWTGTFAQADLPADTRCTVAYNCLFYAAPSFSGTMPTFVLSDPLDVNGMAFAEYQYAGPLYEYTYEYGVSNFVTVNSTSVIAGPNCADGIANQDESDVDCGGSTCVPCEDGFSCTVAGDCIGGGCSLSVCVTV